MYYRKANAAMLCYDITNRETFEDMQSWVNGKFYIHTIGQSLTVSYQEIDTIS